MLKYNCEQNGGDIVPYYTYKIQKRFLKYKVMDCNKVILNLVKLKEQTILFKIWEGYKVENEFKELIKTIPYEEKIILRDLLLNLLQSRGLSPYPPEEEVKTA